MAHPSLLKTEVWGSTGKSLPIIDHIAGAGRDPYQSWHSGDKSCLWITLQPPPEELAFLPGGEVGLEEGGHCCRVPSICQLRYI